MFNYLLLLSSGPNLRPQKQYSQRGRMTGDKSPFEVIYLFLSARWDTSTPLDTMWKGVFQLPPPLSRQEASSKVPYPFFVGCRAWAELRRVAMVWPRRRWPRRGWASSWQTKGIPWKSTSCARIPAKAKAPRRRTGYPHHSVQLWVLPNRAVHQWARRCNATERKPQQHQQQ